MPNRNRRNKRKKNKNKRRARGVESSTPSSSTPSSEHLDDTRQLLQGGACGSSRSGESTSTECHKGDENKPESERRSPCRNLDATSSRNRSDNSPCLEHLDVPEQASGGPISPSKRSSLDKFMGFFSHKKSPNRSRTPERSGKDNSNRESGCPEIMEFKAEAKDQSRKGKASVKPNESELFSRHASPVPLMKEDGSQSFSSSNPGVKERSGNVPECEQHHLAVPGQEREVGPKSPTKMSLFQQLKTKLSPKKKSPHLCNCTDKNNHESDCTERNKDKSPKTSPNKSESPGNVSQQRQYSEDSNTTSGSSRPSYTKASGASVPSSKYSPAPNRSILTSGYASGDTSPNRSDSQASPSNPTDYDPGEGTSKGSAVDRHSSGGFSTFRRLLRRSLGSYKVEYHREDLVSLIQNMDYDSEEDEGMNQQRVIRRCRSKSFLSEYSIRLTRRRSPSPRPRRTEDPLDRVKNELHAIRTELHNRIGPYATESREEREAKDREILNERARTSTTPTARRYKSASPHPLERCQCEHSYLHDIGCSRQVLARQRRKLKRCRQDVPR
ncbi:serine/arginine repetitive matrix protein 2-like [Argiope bruennichi]|uniref:serine/arginine repetitive matrix protein 2-like n=1 Tax=Argiope bruennichi TaxID=94029 RepID=UPI0024951459|nr:serine/arginine repetitive matrix protein 2-like [Argiope bruennichi]